MSTPWAFAFALLWLLVILVGLIMAGTLRRISGVLEQTEARLRELPLGAGPGGLELGAPLPEFQAQRLQGGWATDGDVRGLPAVILFLSADCPPCKLLARELRRGRELGVPLYVILNTAEEARDLGVESFENVLTQTSGEVSQTFRTSATPHAFAIARNGTVVASDTPNTREKLHDLAQSALTEGGNAPGQQDEEVFSLRKELEDARS